MRGSEGTNRSVTFVASRAGVSFLLAPLGRMLFPAVGIFVCLSSLGNTQYLLGLAEGEVCAEKPEGQSICTPFKQCTHVDLKILRPAICSFRGRDPIICCPPKLKIGKAETSCLKHRELCNQFTMFRNNGGPNSPRKKIEWTEDVDNEAAVLETPGDILAETQTQYQEPETTTPAESSTRLPTNDEMSTTGAADINDQTTTQGSWAQNSTGDPGIAKQRQFVVGGHFSLPRTQRHMALIGYGPKNNIDWRCGGSLVSDIWVLSAAHCTTTTDLGSAKWARLGELDHSTNTDDARPQDRRIVQRINHPEYKPTLKYNDIALYKLESRVLYDQFIAPVCLHTTYEIDQSKATVVGWGRTDFADDLSSRLMEVDITLINSTECRRLYGNGDGTTPRGIDRLSMLCAGEKEGGKDACTGDSGGPLVVNQLGSCLKKQVGITSFGRDCGRPNSPGIYTRVSTYVPWIESIVWP